MAEKPILFCDEMVQAIQSGRKTHTRRLVKPQPPWKDKAPRPRYVAHDILWVKQAWCEVEWVENKGEEVVKCLYRSDNPSLNLFDPSRGDRWRSSMFMPKRCARLWLEVRAAYTQRLCDITEGGAKAEGFDSTADFVRTWDRLHPADGERFQDDPLVWVYKFERWPKMWRGILR